jgi:hypothetical protein
MMILLILRYADSSFHETEFISVSCTYIALNYVFHTELYFTLNTSSKKKKNQPTGRRHPAGVASCSVHPSSPSPVPQTHSAFFPGGGDWASGAALRQVSFRPIAGDKFRLGTPTVSPPTSSRCARVSFPNPNVSYLYSDLTQLRVSRCIIPTNFDSTHPPIGSSIDFSVVQDRSGHGAGAVFFSGFCGVQLNL